MNYKSNCSRYECFSPQIQLHETMTSDSTALRFRPNQARSRATFQKILETSAALLEEVGWDGFNTNLLAERSGHRPAAIYRYFPNKLAIVSTLAEQLVAEWDDWLTGFNDRLNESGDIKEAWSFYVRRFPDILRSQPGGVAVRRAMQASPVLREIDQKDNALLADQLAISLVRVMPDLDDTQAKTAARVLLESAVGILDLIIEASPADGRQLMDEMLAMHGSYLDQLGSPQKQS